MKYFFPYFSSAARAVSQCRVRLIIGCMAGLIAAAPPAFAESPGVFGTDEIESIDLSAFTKWNSMLARAVETAAGSEPIFSTALENSGKCRPNPRFHCQDEALGALVHELSDKSLAEKLAGVNQFMNRVQYITDDVNWGVADYWATPAEFFQNSGDCEDFAIAKYIALKRLGIDPRTMRIVVLEDENLGAHHAVLIVETAGGRMVLDNQILQVVADTEIFHYRPIYSINEQAWWLHIPANGESLLAQRNR